MTPEERERAIEQALQREMEAKGLVQHEGRWITLEEKQKIEEGLVLHEGEWISEKQAMALAKSRQRLHVAGVAIDVHGHARARPRSQGPFDLVDIEIPGRRIHVDHHPPVIELEVMDELADGELGAVLGHERLPIWLANSVASVREGVRVAPAAIVDVAAGGPNRPDRRCATRG